MTKHAANHNANSSFLLRAVIVISCSYQTLLLICHMLFPASFPRAAFTVIQDKLRFILTVYLNSIFGMCYSTLSNDVVATRWNRSTNGNHRNVMLPFDKQNNGSRSSLTLMLFDIDIFIGLTRILFTMVATKQYRDYY